MWSFLSKKPFLNEQTLNRISIIAGVFSFIICVLLIANFLQIHKADPINMKVITTLVERLNQNPADSVLRQEIRTLDLLSRKAYFTSQWQLRMGGYLLLAGIAIMLIALQLISLNKKRMPVLSGEHEVNSFLLQKNSRRWIIGGGLAVLFLAVLFGFLSNSELKDRFSKAAGVTVVSSDSTSAFQQTVPENPSSIGKPADTASKSSQQLPVSNSAISQKVSTEIKNSANTITSNDNYPSFRGQGGYGIILQKNIPSDWDGSTGKNIRWKTTVPLPGNSSPVIWGDRIFLTGASESKREVYCFDRNSGKLLWTAQVENITGSSKEVPKVTKETGFASPTPVVNATGVYAVFSNGDLIALDLSGKQLWSISIGLPQNHYGHASSLQIYNDLLIIQYDQRTGSKIFALSTVTGKTVWSTTRPVKVSWSSPIIINTSKGPQVITCADPYVAGYDAKNGNELWKVDAISGEVGPSAAYANGIVFTVNDYSKLAAIKLDPQPVQIWENNEYLSDIPSPVATDKYLIVVTSYGVVACYDPLTGNKYWEKELDAPVYSSPVIAENKVYLMDKTGKMHIFKLEKEFSAVAETKLGESSVSTPAFSNGRIYIRGEKNLYCISK
jgi:outer membrane protein assembly factor BamB